jgi:integrase
MGKRKQQGAWVRTWLGGRVWRAEDGTETFYIRRRVGTKRYDLSTRCTSEHAAQEHLRRFEKDPAAYRPEGDRGAEPIYLDADLTRDFLRWSLKEKHNTPKWVGQQKLYLAWWAEKLQGVNLRGASLRDRILPALAKTAARPQKIAVLKVVYSWLRTVRHDLETAEDPTFGQLAVPQAQPAQLTKSKAVPIEHVALAIEHLDSERWRDLLRILAGTGAHVAELQRFAASGRVERLPRDGTAEGAAGVVVLPSTKSGGPLRVAVSAVVLEAARRTLEAGPFDSSHFQKAITRACLAANIPAFGAGTLRHSVATAAVNRGADPAQVATFLGHRSARTTRKFYATLATPVRIPALL